MSQVLSGSALGRKELTVMILSQKKITHDGFLVKGKCIGVFKGYFHRFNDYRAWTAFTSKDGLFWITTLDGNLYNINPLKNQIPYYNESTAVNSFYKEPGKNILWIATNKGLIRKDLIRGIENVWRREPLNKNSLCSDSINALRVDDEGNFWMATTNGLNKFDPLKNTFTTYTHNEKDTNSLSSNYLRNLFIDHNKNIWIGTQSTGWINWIPKQINSAILKFFQTTMALVLTILIV
jgi:ligand-binding sensor domain-containing protein